MFDFHAHSGLDNKDSFISLMSREELNAECAYESIGKLSWLDGFSFDEVSSLIRDNACLHVGEFGLDRTKGELEDQMDDFLFMADLARAYDRIAVIHSVHAANECLKTLESMKIRRAIFHSFQSSYEEALKIERKGYFISLSPRSFRTRDIGRLLTLDFLLETDMETGARQKEILSELYDKAREMAGMDIERKIEGIREDLWKDSF